jgi:hypothetical protein
MCTRFAHQTLCLPDKVPALLWLWLVLRRHSCLAITFASQCQTCTALWLLMLYLSVPPALTSPGHRFWQHLLEVQQLQQSPQHNSSALHRQQLQHMQAASGGQTGSLMTAAAVEVPVVFEPCPEPFRTVFLQAMVGAAAPAGEAADGVAPASQIQPRGSSNSSLTGAAAGLCSQAGALSGNLVSESGWLQLQHQCSELQTLDLNPSSSEDGEDGLQDDDNCELRLQEQRQRSQPGELSWDC